MITTAQLGQMALIGQIGGGASSVVGSFFSAKSQKAQLKAQAAIAETNAKIAELGAQSAMLQGQQQAGQISLRAGQLKGAQRAAMAANGIDLGSGSAAEVQASTEIAQQIDTQAALDNAVLAAWGYRMQAVNEQNRALTARATASGINPLAAAATSLIGSATQVAGSWYGLSQGGVFGRTSTPTGGGAGGYQRRGTAADPWLRYNTLS